MVGAFATEVHLLREGNDPQPVTIALASLPAGITGPESIAIAADQTHAEFELQIASDAALDVAHELTLNASSKFMGQDFTVTSTHALPMLVESPKKLVRLPERNCVGGFSGQTTIGGYRDQRTKLAA